MTQPQLPPCRDFICEVAREIRQVPSSKQTAPAGTSVKRIYAVVEDSPYSDDDYRAAMMEMLEDDSIVLVCMRTIEGSSRRGYHDIVLDIKTIPDWYDFKTSAFSTDYVGGQFDIKSHRQDGDGIRGSHRRLKNIDHIRYEGVTLYVVQDGLPLRAQRAIQKSGGIDSVMSIADRILRRIGKS